MKHFKNFIKGSVLSLIFILAFSLNFSATNSSNQIYSHLKPQAVHALNPTGAINNAANAVSNAANSAVNSTKGAASSAASTANANAKKPTTKQVTNLPEGIVQSIAKASTFINKVFNPVIYFLTKHIGGLLSNDYIYGPHMAPMLQRIWVVSRNIVNIAFVLILLFLALRHIFSGDENSDLKKALPTFVIMLIAINFSWLGVKLVLDAANVATNVAFAIPSGIGEVQQNALKPEPCVEDPTSPTGLKGQCMVSSAYYPFDAVNHRNLLYTQCQKIGSQYDEAYPKTGTGKPITNISKTSTFCWQTLQLGDFARSNAAYHLSYGMANVQNLPLSTGKTDIAKVSIGTLVAIVVQVVYIVAFGSLFVALIIRNAMLWILVAFSPFMVLLYYLNKNLNLNAGDEVGKYLSFGSLASWAFVPTKVAAVWAIGFIMITTGQTATQKLAFRFEQGSNFTSKVFSVNSLFMNMDNLEQFIWLLMTIGIIWIGTFAVLGNLNVGSGLFQSINNYGTSLAKELASSPRWAPIIPMLDPATGKLGLGSYAQKGFDPLKDIRDMKSHFTNVPINKYKDLEKKFKKDPKIVQEIDQGASPAERLKRFQKHTGFNNDYIKNANNKPYLENLIKAGNFKKLTYAELLASANKSSSSTPSATSTVPTPAAPTELKIKDPNALATLIGKKVEQYKKEGKNLSDDQVKKISEASKNAYTSDKTKDIDYYWQLALKAAGVEEKKPQP